MLPTKTNINNTGSLGGHNVKMTFDENSVAFLQSVLIDLYSDPELAVIREYSTNARDSHIEAGQTRPIEITTPSSFTPNFVVRDYGVGLSFDDIVNIYSKYGASTKRQTNEQAGMLGLGCKSALTYTNQFTVAGIKDGKKVIVLVYRTEDGAGAMEIVDESETDECNGVTITVPVKPTNNFIHKTNEFFAFWPEDSVLINGSKPNFYEPVVKVTDTISLYKGNRSDVIVMAGIPYSITNGGHEPCIVSNGQSWSSNHDYFVVAHVNIGDVDFTPSREALQFTAKTKAVVDNVRSEFTNNLNDGISQAIEDCETYITAASFVYSLKYNYNLDRYVRIRKPIWRGKEILDRVDGFKGYYNFDDNRYSKQNTDVHINGLDGSGVLYNFNLKSLSTVGRQKLVKYIGEDNMPRFIYVCEELPADEAVFEKSILVDWEVVKEVKLPKDPKQPKAQKPKDWYTVITPEGTKKNTQDLEGTIAFISLAEIKPLSDSSIRQLPDLFEWDMLVLIGKNSYDKFKRNFPKAVYAKTIIYDKIRTYMYTLSDEEKRRLGLAMSGNRWYAKLDYTKIDDPKLRADIKLLSEGAKVSKQLNTFNSMQSLAWSLNINMNSHIVTNFNIFKLYSLVDEYHSCSNLEEVVVYLNSWYNYLKEKNEV